ncbi:hypothetical protein DERP_008138 [Dermatophagoides pteronyssinus]|uniref:Uncharacterized protein n=1 Tax=Dermatophagoides pteronyssinus TaxID=6956 RepID=A0ABQ8JKF5_DERPT|nr:hypothetical protein DERP_008138 [Dermatophagoides pteronyssinus]
MPSTNDMYHYILDVGQTSLQLSFSIHLFISIYIHHKVCLCMTIPLLVFTAINDIIVHCEKNSQLWNNVLRV